MRLLRDRPEYAWHDGARSDRKIAGTADTPAILITNHPSAAVIDRAKRADIPIVEKPFLNAALVDGIRAVCFQHSVSETFSPRDSACFYSERSGLK